MMIKWSVWHTFWVLSKKTILKKWQIQYFNLFYPFSEYWKFPKRNTILEFLLLLIIKCEDKK